VEHVAAPAGEQLPDPLGGVAFRLTGLCEVGGGVGFEPVGDVRAGLLERPEPVGRPHRSPVPGPPEQQPGPAGLGVLPQVHLDVVDQRGRDRESAGRDALAGRLQRPDLDLALGLLHRLVNLHRRDVAGEVEVTTLQCPHLTRPQPEHTPQQDTEPPRCGHLLRDGVQHVDRQRIRLTFPRRLRLGGRLDLHRVRVDELGLDG